MDVKLELLRLEIQWLSLNWLFKNSFIKGMYKTAMNIENITLCYLFCEKVMIKIELILKKMYINITNNI